MWRTSCSGSAAARSQALTVQRPAYVIGIGMWLALIMAVNVWFVILPNQKKILGIVDASSDERPRPRDLPA
jgi:uncharacterized membrane protein